MVVGRRDGLGEARMGKGVGVSDGDGAGGERLEEQVKMAEGASHVKARAVAAVEMGAAMEMMEGRYREI